MRSRVWTAVMAVALAVAAHGRAEAACTLGKIAELPVTMDEMGPMVEAGINGRPVRFIADSGAFYSVISPGAAQSLQLQRGAGPYGMTMRGINGTAQVGIATVRTFTLAGVDIPRVQFLVGGSEMQGVGVIGQNVLGFADVEYDLPHGAIRLMRSSGCGHANLAYWAGTRSFSIEPIAPRSPDHPHTIGTVQVNGVSVHATFDTGASTSILSMAAAARAGLRPGGPGVTDGGMTWGFGRRLVRTWIGPLESFSVGDGEQIRGARIRFGEVDGDFDMLIGADFFIAHRVYVDNADHRLFLTYEGGPIFNLKARYDGPGAPDAAPVALPAGAATTATNAEAASRDGAVAMARNDADTAIADFTRAIAANPSEPRYLDQRAHAYFERGKTALGTADLDRAIGLAPTDLSARLARAALRLRARDRAGALPDLDAADHAADAAAMERLELGGLLTEAGQPARAVGQFDQWIKAHPDDVRRPSAFNGRCWARALGGSDLDAALRDCDAALRARPGSPSFLDSRGLVRLRQGDWARAVADYDAALAKQPKLAWSLYGRGLARQHSGDATAAKADLAAAIAIEPHIAEDAASFGIGP